MLFGTTSAPPAENAAGCRCLLAGTIISATNISIITYAGDGLWRQQEDIYNPLRFVQAALKWCRKAQDCGTLDTEAAAFLKQYGGSQ